MNLEWGSRWDQLCLDIENIAIVSSNDSKGCFGWRSGCINIKLNPRGRRGNLSRWWRWGRWRLLRDFQGGELLEHSANGLDGIKSV